MLFCSWPAGGIRLVKTDVSRNEPRIRRPACLVDLGNLSLEIGLVDALSRTYIVESHCKRSDAEELCNRGLRVDSHSKPVTYSPCDTRNRRQLWDVLNIF
jgi:hypothetical protein